MKFLIVRTYPSEMNIETYNVQEIGLAKAIIRKGYDCDVALFTKSNSHMDEIIIEEKVLRIYWIHGRKFAGQGIYNKKELLQLAYQYDFVQVNEYNQIASFYLASKLKAKCYIYHGPYRDDNAIKYNLQNKIFDVIYLKRLIKLETLIFAKSKLAEQFLINKGFSKVYTIGVGVDIDRLKAKEEVNEDIKSNKEFNLLYIGEISERRNSIFLLDVVKKVIEGMDKKVTLTIIGNGTKRYLKKFNKHVDDLEIKNNLVHLTKLRQNELGVHYEMADLFLFPTKYDIFGMVLLEAMYYGVPIISSKNGGANTLFEKEDEGCILEKYDVDEWADNCVRLLRHSAHRSYISINEREKLIQNYTWDSIAKKIINYLNPTIYMK